MLPPAKVYQLHKISVKIMHHRDNSGKVSRVETKVLIYKRNFIGTFYE